MEPTLVMKIIKVAAAIVGFISLVILAAIMAGVIKYTFRGGLEKETKREGTWGVKTGVESGEQEEGKVVKLENRG